MTPMVSIVTPAYNAEKTIADTILSVLNQTYNNWEMIIVDDCSNDKTKEVINSFEDKRIKPIFLNKNKKVANARNEAIKAATGEYIAFLDSDDLWEKSKLEKQVAFMQEKKYDFTYTNYNVIDEDGKYVKEIITNKHEVDYKTLLKSNFIGCLTIMIKTDIMKKNLMPAIGHEDYATWLTILKNDVDKAYLLNEKLAKYRLVSNSVSSNKLKVIKWTWNIYRKNQKLGFIKSISLILVWGYYAMKKYRSG